MSPNSVPIFGLAPDTAYEVRVVATNYVGTTTGNSIFFTTGHVAVDGEDGASRTAGCRPAAPARRGRRPATPAPRAHPAHPARAVRRARSRTLSSEILNLVSGDPRALIRIDATRISVPRSGRNIGRVRVKIFCRGIAVQTCSGQVKSAR